ncbi:DUF1819 family protein [Intestinibacter sp.]
MIIKKEYSATNMTVRLLQKELKITAKLLREGITPAEIRKKSYEENIYQARSENFKKTVTSIVLNRAKTLDEGLIEMMSEAGLEVGRQIAVYSVMKSDRLFFEFMREVFAEKIINKENKIYATDIDKFMNSKREQSEKINSWAKTTTNRLGNSYLGMLYEADFAKKQNDYAEIILPIIDYKLDEYLKNINEKIYLDIMTGEY